MTQNEFNNLLSSVKSLSPGQMRRLHRQLDAHLSKSKEAAPQTADLGDEHVRTVEPSNQSLAIAEIHRQMLASGLIVALPDPAQDLDDDDPADQPVPIQGEPLSATILRERR